MRGGFVGWRPIVPNTRKLERTGKESTGWLLNSCPSAWILAVVALGPLDDRGDAPAGGRTPGRGPALGARRFRRQADAREPRSGGETAIRREGGTCPRRSVQAEGPDRPAPGTPWRYSRRWRRTTPSAGPTRRSTSITGPAFAFRVRGLVHAGRADEHEAAPSRSERGCPARPARRGGSPGPAASSSPTAINLSRRWPTTRPAC